MSQWLRISPPKCKIWELLWPTVVCFSSKVTSNFTKQLCLDCRKQFYSQYRQVYCVNYRPSSDGITPSVSSSCDATVKPVTLASQLLKYSKPPVLFSSTVQDQILTMMTHTHSQAENNTRPAVTAGKYTVLSVTYTCSYSVESGRRVAHGNSFHIHVK